MFFTERNRQEGILAKPQKKLKQAARIFMALVLGVSLWGQGEVGCAGDCYYFNNPSSNNTIVFDENGNLSSSTSTRSSNPVTVRTHSNGLEVIAGYDLNGNGASNNNLTINGGTYDDIIGGFSTTVADNNTITFNNGTASNIQGYQIAQSANGNTVNINGGTVSYVHNTNTLNINGGTLSEGAIYVDVVNINGGKVSSIIVGNSSAPGEINIYNNPDISEAYLSGTAVSSGSGMTFRSTLNIHTKNLSVVDISAFKDINFYLPSDIANGDTVLTVTNPNGTELSGSNIRAGIEGDANLTTGDTITLIKNPNGIRTDTTSYGATTYGTLSEGVSLDYELTVEKADDTSIVARVGSASSSPEGTSSSGDTGKFSSGGPNTSGGSGTSGTSALKTQTNVLPAPLLASTTLTLHGTDRLLDWLPPEDPVVGDDTSEGKDDSQENVAKAESPNEFQIFANTGFSNLRTKIGGNSYMDNHSAGFDLGAARTLENSRGRLVFAPIVDYGSGSYDVYNDGRHGSGNSKYWAAGMIARQMNKDGFYYEASFRAGRAMVDFASDDFTQGGVPTRVTYDASAPCFAGHVRVGKIYQFGPRNQLHLYGIYSHNHQNGMSAKLSTGETYQFSAVDSGRLRIGGRLSWQKSKTQKFYSGIAYQYEFSNGATGSYKGYSTNSSSIHGSSAMIELGWQIKPSQKSPWMVDVNAAGWVGHQKGFTIQAKLMKSF